MNNTVKYLSILFLLSGIFCQAQKSIIRDHVNIDVSTYKEDNETKASAMPELKRNSKLMKYKRRI